MTRIVLATYGSLGDLHPYIAIAKEWNSRGNVAAIATSEVYRPLVEGEGIEFAPTRPNMPDGPERAALMKKVMDPHGGPRYLLRDIVMPAVRDSYYDLIASADGADAIIGHPLTFSVPFAARTKGIPWAYCALSPITFLSAYDPPLVFGSRLHAKIVKLGPKFHGPVIWAARKGINSLLGEVRQLSRELKIYPFQREPIGVDQYSPYLNLALFSSTLASAQKDWPSNTVICGYPYYDCPPSLGFLSADLEKFLQTGEAPILFTLGSAAVGAAGKFYEQSALAACAVGRRAVLLVGRHPENLPANDLPSSIFVAEYAPYSLLLPRCAAVVHQGGIGTTSQALLAGTPMLVMPFAFDQPDNAHRAQRLGVARAIARSSYSSKLAASELLALLSGRYAEQAKTISRLIRMENGAATACNAIEQKLLSAANSAL